MPVHHLLKGATLWGLDGLYDSMAEGIEALRKTGVTSIEASDFVITDEIAVRVREAGMRWVVQCYPMKPDDLDAALELALKVDAIMLNAHAGTPHGSAGDTEELVSALIEKAAAADVKLVFETHRGRITQDLYRTSHLVRQVPGMRLNLDVSHYVVCEEKPGPIEALAPLFWPLLDRVDMIHGRIGNGQQIQVDFGDGAGELPQLYRRFWAETMRQWRLRSPVGATLIFTPELGPPPYAIVDTRGAEFSNRWEQAEIMWKLAQQAWADSMTTSEKLWGK